MKNRLFRILLLVGYCIPYAFLSMNGDVVSGTMKFYGIMILAFAVLSYFAVKVNSIAVIAIGNLFSWISSYFFMLHYLTERWGWYFKPFTPTTLLPVISFIAFGIQLGYALGQRKRQRERDLAEKQKNS